MTDEDREILKKQSDATLAKWWCILNLWGWPDKLPNPEPRSSAHNSRRAALMVWIQRQIGTKRCLEEWNKPVRGTPAPQ